MRFCIDLQRPNNLVWDAYALPRIGDTLDTLQRAQWFPTLDTGRRRLQKKISTSASMLWFADFSKPFKINTYAGLEGLGAILYKKQDHHDRVITHAGRWLSRAEVNYPVHKLGVLSAKMCRHREVCGLRAWNKIYSLH